MEIRKYDKKILKFIGIPEVLLGLAVNFIILKSTGLSVSISKLITEY